MAVRGVAAWALTRVQLEQTASYPHAVDPCENSRLERISPDVNLRGREVAPQFYDPRPNPLTEKGSGIAFHALRFDLELQAELSAESATEKSHRVREMLARGSSHHDVNVVLHDRKRPNAHPEPILGFTHESPHESMVAPQHVITRFHDDVIPSANRDRARDFTSAIFFFDDEFELPTALHCMGRQSNFCAGAGGP